MLIVSTAHYLTPETDIGPLARNATIPVSFSVWKFLLCHVLAS